MKEDIKFVTTVVAFLFFGLLALAFMGLIGSILLSPVKVVQKTFDADNIIHNYEWFHDANGAVKARIAQIKGHKKIVGETKDPIELSRLRIELSAMQQSCRDLTNRYNANAEKVNRSIFQRGVPSRLDPTECE